MAPQAIILEPEGRNTAPAVAAAALMLSQGNQDALLLVLPSDHVVTDLETFHAAVEVAARAASKGVLVTFGMAPTKPETGFGYIRCGEPLDGVDGCYRIARFVEKPETAVVQSMLSEGGWLWNSGMFLFSAARYVRELEQFQPEMVEACRAAVEGGRSDLDFFRLDEDAFRAASAESIDYAIMEHTSHVAVVPTDMGWNDIGSWSALWEIGQKDGDGNISIGDVIAEDVGDSYLRTDNCLLAVLGVHDLLIVATADAILVAAKNKAQDVKKIVDRLKTSQNETRRSHLMVHRPWGSFQSLDAGENFQVKQLTVKPGAKLSLQKHNHRAEHWVVVSGTARVTLDEEIIELTANQSTYIPVGAKHRLENPGDQILRVIEVQSGDYLGEDDIVRFEDIYGREDKKHS